ncbi:MAG: hypothetical protein AB7F59_06010 [Bdellovibrionales bacterium]
MRINIFLFFCVSFLGSMANAQGQNWMANNISKGLSGSTRNATVQFGKDIPLNQTSERTLESACSSGWSCVLLAAQYVQTGMSVYSLLKSEDASNAATCRGLSCTNPNGSSGVNTNPYVGAPGASPTGPTGSATPTTYTPSTKVSSVPLFKMPTSGQLGPKEIQQLKAIAANSQARLQNLMNKGFNYDPATGMATTPQGTAPLSSLTTVEGLKKVGASEAEISSIQSALASIAQTNKKMSAEAAKMLVKASPNFGAEEGSDGGFGVGGGKPDLENGFDVYLASLQNSMRGPSSKTSLQGLSVMVRGEPVGIAGGNIFETINTRYDLLRQQGVVGEIAKP